MLSQTHPLFGDEMIAAGIAAFGDGPWGWRIMSALAGVVLVALVYPLARRLLLRRSWAVIATGLTACDTLLIAQSRVGMLDGFVALWTVACVYCALRAARAPRSGRWLVLCGMAGGLAASTKWSGAFAILAAFAVLLLWRRRRHVNPLRLVVALLVLPGALYVITFAPYFAAGHGLSQWIELQRQMASHGWTLHHPDSNSLAPLSWFSDASAIWYRWGLLGGSVRGLVAVGNPLLWWGALVSLVALTIAAIRRRSRLLGMHVVLVACLYVPWLATDRTSYIYYMAPVVPLLAVALARGLSLLRPRLAIAYAVATAAPTALWLPFLVSIPVPYAYYHAVMLLPAWR
jgi:dolichyl-phosphate-mannose-protein mannosyltransferase